MDRSAEVLVRAGGLRKEYGSGAGLIRAVDGVDLEVARGEAVAVRGPSGCGKSTLLHLLGGLDRPTAGELWLNGRRIDRALRACPRPAATPRGRLRLPGVPSHGRAHRPGERRASRAPRRPFAAGGPAGRPPAPRAGRARRPGRSPALGALGRRAATGRHRPRAGQRADRRASPTSPPATSTAPPPWRCCGSSRPCTRMG